MLVTAPIGTANILGFQLWADTSISELLIAGIAIVQACVIGMLLFQRWKSKRQAALETDRQRDALARLTRIAMMGELAASLAHELNQPLSAIVANAAAGKRMAGQGVGVNEFQDLFQDIVNDSKRAGDVIHSIRSMVSKGQGVRQEMDFNGCIGEVLRLMNSDLLVHETSVATSQEHSLPSVMADPVQMQQILINLIMNGLEAMAGIPASQRRLLISSRSDSIGVTLEVRDFGAGLPDDSDKVFEQFYSTKQEGMGMGLAIVRSIVQAHGGEVHAENAAGGGAVFRVRLPLAPQAADLLGDSAPHGTKVSVGTPTAAV